MAEERNTGLTAGSDANTGIARAPEVDTAIDAPDDTETTKQELQRRMEEARESISQTVSEIKDTVTTQYDSVRTTINENLDWREHVRKSPTAFSIGAGTVGFFLGLAIAGAFKGGRDESDYSEYEYEYDEDDDTYSPTPTARSYRAQTSEGAISGSEYAMSSPSRHKSSSASLASYGTTTTTEADEPSGPSIFERFKNTQAYDKLTNEITTLGSRVVDELSHTAQTVVLPMVLGKLKDAVGIDLNTQKKVAERTSVERQASEAHAKAVESNEDVQSNS